MPAPCEFLGCPAFATRRVDFKQETSYHARKFLLACDDHALKLAAAKGVTVSFIDTLHS